MKFIINGIVVLISAILIFGLVYFAYLGSAEATNNQLDLIPTTATNIESDGLGGTYFDINGNSYWTNGVKTKRTIRLK